MQAQKAREQHLAKLREMMKPPADAEANQSAAAPDPGVSDPPAKPAVKSVPLKQTQEKSAPAKRTASKTAPKKSASKKAVAKKKTGKR